MVSKRARWWAAALLALVAVTGCRAGTDAPSSPRVKAVLAQRCMIRLGFTDFPADPKRPRSYASSLLTIVGTSASLGPLDLDQAKRWGYGWEPKRRKALEPTGRAMTDAEYAALYAMSSSETTPSGRKPPPNKAARGRRTGNCSRALRAPGACGPIPPSAMRPF
ncbi:hypothetical protein AB4Z54_25985, partial [Streptomyces sp. MCAF7]